MTIGPTAYCLDNRDAQFLLSREGFTTMCRSKGECSAHRSRRRCDGTTTGATDAARKAQRGRDRALERLTSNAPAAVAAFYQAPEEYWHEVRTSPAGFILGTRAKRAAERAAYLAGSADVNVVRLGLHDRAAVVRKAAARHSLAEEARQPIEHGPGALTPRDTQRLAAYRAHLEAKQATAPGAVTAAHWAYLAASEQHLRGLRPPPLSPEQEADWAVQRSRLQGRARQQFIADRYRRDWEWASTHGRTTQDFPTWWTARSRQLHQEDLATGAVIARPQAARIDWSRISYEEADQAVRAGTVSLSRVPLDTRGWRLRERWRAEKAAETGNASAATAVDLAARFNTRRGLPSVRAIPYDDGSVLVESLHGAPQKVSARVTLAGLDRTAAEERLEQAVAGLWASPRRRAA